MAKPGPGKGWRWIISGGRPSCFPKFRTSSLKSSRKGSLSLNCIFLPQKPIVDEDADQFFFDRLINQRRSDGRIDAAAEATEHPAVSDLLADPVDRSLDKVLHSPGRLTTADAKDKVIEDFLAPR